MRRLVLMLAIVPLSATLSAESRDEATRLAVDAVVGQTGADPGSIEVESTQRIEWPDARLGCENAARADAPQPAHGHRVLLRAASKVYAVHVTEGRAVLCAGGLAAASAPQEVSTMQGNADPPPDPADAASRALVAEARDDLARRLSVMPGDVRLVAFKSVVWPDNSFGCPRPGMAYTQVPRDGVLIRFEVDGRRFDYHGGSGREPFLCEREK